MLEISFLQNELLINEVASLKQRVKWYAENQALLDEDAETMKAKDEEIKNLKDRVRTLMVGVIMSFFYCKICRSILVIFYYYFF